MDPQVPTSTGVILPQESLRKLNFERGDTLFAVQTPDGYLHTPYDPELARQLKLGQEVLAEHRDALSALAT